MWLKYSTSTCSLITRNMCFTILPIWRVNIIGINNSPIIDTLIELLDAHGHIYLFVILLPEKLASIFYSKVPHIFTLVVPAAFNIP